MRPLCLLLLGSMLTSALRAQTVSGVVKDDKDKPSDGTTVSLLRAKDSSSVKYAVTGADGRFQFVKVNDGEYIVKATLVGHLPAFSSRVSVTGSDVPLPALVLVKASGQLKGVTVSANRPMVEVKADKMIVNVEGTINAT